MEAVFLKLLNMSVTACWLVLAVVILRLLLKKAPRAIICALWALVALRLLIPFSIESPLSLVPDPEPVQTQLVQQPQMTHSPEFLAGAIVTEVAGSVGSAPAAEPLSVLPIVSWIWLAGMAVMALYALVSYLLVLRKTKEGVEQEKGVWHCDRIGSPFILGIIRPRIYLPSDMNSDDMPYVLAHERAHLKRMDHLWKPLGFLLLTVYWFNPVMWLAYILLCRDIELACDEKVLRQLGTEVKQDYSTALINCSVPRRLVSACPLAFGEVGVKKRIKSILNYKKPAFWIILVALIAAVAVAVCFLTDPEKKQEEKTVTLEIVSQQKDSVTVEWVNNTDEHIVIGYDEIYYKDDGKWVKLFESFEIALGTEMWTRSLAPGQTYQQIVYHYFVGITHPGEYRLDMKYVDPAGEDKLISLVYTVSRMEEYEQNYVGPIWTRKLTCQESPDALKPTILLSTDGQFWFSYAGLSSYVAIGSYEENSQELVLTTSDWSNYVYRFKKEGETYRFDAANSSPLPQYKYDGVLQSPIPDGGIFASYSSDSPRIISAVSVPAYVDSDDVPEYWTVTYQPNYGLQVFEITAVDPEGKIMYRDLFQYECRSLTVHKNQEGNLQLIATKVEGASSKTVTFEITVENGHIKLTSPDETLLKVGYGAIE